MDKYFIVFKRNSFTGTDHGSLCHYLKIFKIKIIDYPDLINGPLIFKVKSNKASIDLLYKSCSGNWDIAKIL